LYFINKKSTGFRGVLLKSEVPQLVPENKPRSTVRYLFISLKKSRRYLIIKYTTF